MKLNCTFYLVLIGFNLIMAAVLDRELRMGRDWVCLVPSLWAGLSLEQRLSEGLLNE